MGLGIQNAVADWKPAQVSVYYDAARVSSEEIYQVVTMMGHHVTLIEAPEVVETIVAP